MGKDIKYTTGTNDIDFMLSFINSVNRSSFLLSFLLLDQTKYQCRVRQEAGGWQYTNLKFKASLYESTYFILK